MRLIPLITAFLLTTISNAQTSLKEINLENGAYNVGFKHYTIIDSTRLYRVANDFNNKLVFRPIPISIWYPAIMDTENSKQLTVLDYLEILKEEEESKKLPSELLLDWFPDLGGNTPQNRIHLSEKVNASLNAEFIEGKFPVVVYAPSFRASSIENFALFEYLASNGFVVISSPSRGTDTRWLEGGTKAMETQSRDVEFLLKEIYQYKSIASDRIALMGFSFGGLSNAIMVMKNKKIRALVSLDGTERYEYSILEKSPYFNLDRFTIPYIHFAQKDIPEEVLTSDKISAELNYKFQLYDSLKYSNAYSYKFHDLTHSHFGTIGVLFSYRDKRQDKSDAEIMKSYNLLSQHTLQFLNATLKNEKNAKEFIENNSPDKNGVSKTLVSKKMKKSLTKDFDYTDFKNLALNQGHRELIPLYEKTVAKHPTLQLEEGMLNNLGIRLAFNAGKMEQGINVFLLALHIYPKSANLYDSLALAYLYNRDDKNAIANFKKSLELNPENQHAIDKLKQLKE